jgi:uncharacterized membrane protein YraQ (UPF0718 family)
MTATVTYILASVVLVLVVGFVANYLLALNQNRNARQQADFAPGANESPRPQSKRIEEETKRRPPLNGPEIG